jgi:lysylphosphatidylglycerol synthetase-like protein (DUF2156 family)
MGEKGIEQPYVYIIFAAVGIAFTFLSYRKTFYFLMSWIAMFFLMYGFFFAGDVGWGSNERFALTYYTPLVFFGGAGIALISTISMKISMKLESLVSKKILADKKSHKDSIGLLIKIFLVLLIVASFFLTMPHVATPADKIEEAIQSRTYHDFVVLNMDKIGDDCYVFSHVPSIFLMYGKNSGQLWHMDRVENECKIYDEGYWCNVDPFRGPDSICKQIHRTHNLSLLAQRDLQEYGGHVYSLYYVLKS